MDNKTIIVMEDDEMLRQFCAVELEAQGYSVIQEGNSRHIMELIRLHKPVLVITDLVMPDYEGMEAIFQILRECPVPIIAMSCKDDYLDLIKDEVSAALRKPINGPLLLSTVEAVLKKAS